MEKRDEKGYRGERRAEERRMLTEVKGDATMVVTQCHLVISRSDVTIQTGRHCNSYINNL